MTGISPGRFVAVQAVRDSYALVWDRFDILLKLCTPLILAFLVQVAATIVLPLMGQESLIRILPGTFTILECILLVPVQTRAYRLFLANDSISFGLTYRRTEWIFVWAFVRYMARALLVGLIAMFCLGLLVLAVYFGFGMAMVVGTFSGWKLWAENSPLVALMTICFLAILLVIYAVLVRYELVFPAAALEEHMPLAESVRLVGNDWFKFFLATLLTATPVGVIGFFLMGLASTQPAALPLEAFIHGVTWTISLLLTTALRSIAYVRMKEAVAPNVGGAPSPWATN